MEKVFCIGLWKTGTTSVGMACNKLIGGAHDGNTESKMHRTLVITSIENETAINPLEDLLTITKDFTTFDDYPWNSVRIIKMLKKLYPNAKYILTTRNVDDWHYSAYTFYKKSIESNSLNPFHIWGLYNREFKDVFGDDFDTSNIIKSDLSGMIKNKSLWVKFFNQRNKLVKTIIGNNLLEYNISDNLGWEPICKFLNKDIPMMHEPFPNLNSQIKINNEPAIK